MKTILSRLLLSLAFVFCCSLSYAATYYFSSSGGDDSRNSIQAQSPDTPWKSISKFNSVFKSLKPGDKVLFKSGDTFYGTINISRSGTSSSPIVIGSYGSGAKPVITSLVTLRDWKSIGNGVYESGNSSLGDEVNIVLLNGKVQEMGRYPNSDSPNKGYRTYDSHSGNNSITDKGIPSSPNWNGGEVVIRKNFWIIDRHKISSHSGNRINYLRSPASSYSPKSGYGYFIQNHPNTLDKFGEWYFNPKTKKLQVYFGSASPSSHSLSASTIDYLVTNSSSIRYITFENLNFRGANKGAFLLGKSGSNVKIVNCDIEHSGENALEIEGISSFILEQSNISFSNNNGVVLKSSNGAIIRNNQIENTFIFPGHGRGGDNSGVAILAPSDNGLIEYNKVFNTGYSGINFKGNNTVVKNNLVDGFCLTKNDGAGIYSYAGRTDNFKNRKITGNIVLNGRGVKEGTNFKLLLTMPQAEGIYLDDNVTDVEVVGNTVAHMTSKGIYLHNTKNIRLRDNVIYDNKHQLYLRNDLMGNPLSNTIIEDNQILSKDVYQSHLQIMSIKDDIGKLASFNNNYYATPLMDGVRFKSSHNTGSSRQVNQVFNLESWRSKLGMDKSSSVLKMQKNSFVVKTVKGVNKFVNGTFDKVLGYIGCDNCDTSLDNSGKLDKGSLKVSGSTDSKASVMVGAVKKGKHYILKFSAKSNTPVPVFSYLRQNTSPWETLTADHGFEFTTARQEFETVFSPVADIDNARLMLVIGSGEKVQFWIDNLEFYEVEVDAIHPEDKILFEYNPSQNEKTIYLAGEFVDLKNKRHSGEITIKPYSSLLLINTSAQPSSGSNKAPTVSISTPSTNASFTAGSKIEIKAEASDSDGSIVEVEFYNGSKLLGTSTQKPYTYVWNNVPEGTHLLTVKAKDNKSSVATSSPVAAQVRLSSSVENNNDKNNESSNFKPIFLNTGSSSDLDFKENKFLGDNNHSSYYGKSTSYSESQASSEKIYQTERNNENLKYSIPLPNGVYTVKTYHNELYFGRSGPSARAGRRVFDILIEGAMVKENFDIYEENSNKPTELVFTDIEVKDGVLNINMIASINRASVSAIAITSNSYQEPPVISKNSKFFNTGSSSTTSFQGNTFEGDQNKRSYFNSSKTNVNKSASNQTLYQSERYAKNLKYAIPLPNGTYTIKTFHNELWFGTYGPPASGGKRVFDISIEGKKVKTNFDLFVESGNKPTILTFENIEVKDGFLNLDLLASADNATISGIAVLDVSDKEEMNLANLRMESGENEEEEILLENEEEKLLYENEEEVVKLYPNPAKQSTNVLINKEVVLRNILIHNLNGQLVRDYDPSVLLQNNGEFVIPLNNLSKGVYLVTLVSEKEILKQLRLIVEP